MKVILLDNVKNLGLIGELVEVKRGYARNYLLPRSLALELNKANKSRYEREKDSLDKAREQFLSGAMTLKDGLESLTLDFYKKSEEEGKLFGSVTSQEISTALSSKGFDINKKDISIETPIKHIGKYLVLVRVGPNIRAEVHIEVHKEESLDE